jgi:hypothetical protein
MKTNGIEPQRHRDTEKKNAELEEGRVFLSVHGEMKLAPGSERKENKEGKFLTCSAFLPYSLVFSFPHEFSRIYSLCLCASVVKMLLPFGKFGDRFPRFSRCTC